MGNPSDPPGNRCLDHLVDVYRLLGVSDGDWTRLKKRVGPRWWVRPGFPGRGGVNRDGPCVTGSRGKDYRGVSRVCVPKVRSKYDEPSGIPMGRSPLFLLFVPPQIYKVLDVRKVRTRGTRHKDCGKVFPVYVQVLLSTQSGSGRTPPERFGEKGGVPEVSDHVCARTFSLFRRDVRHHRPSTNDVPWGVTCPFRVSVVNILCMTHGPKYDSQVVDGFIIHPLPPPP